MSLVGNVEPLIVSEDRKVASKLGDKGTLLQRSSRLTGIDKKFY